MNKGLEALKIVKEQPIELHIREGWDIFISVYEQQQENIDTIEKELKRLEAIDNAKPSEALENLRLCWGGNQSMGEYISSTEYEHIEQALLKVQKQEKVLKIILEKGVDVGYLKTCKTLEEYNENCWNDEEDFNKKLIQEEFDVLKEWC